MVVDHSKIKVVHREEVATDVPNAGWWAVAIGAAVFAAVGGAAMFATRLVSDPSDAPEAKE